MLGETDYQYRFYKIHGGRFAKFMGKKESIFIFFSYRERVSARSRPTPPKLGEQILRFGEQVSTFNGQALLHIWLILHYQIDGTIINLICLTAFETEYAQSKDTIDPRAHMAVDEI